MSRRDWDNYEDQVLSAGYCNLYKLEDIASTLKRSVNSIRSRASILNLKRPRKRYATYN